MLFKPKIKLSEYNKNLFLNSNQIVAVSVEKDTFINGDEPKYSILIDCVDGNTIKSDYYDSLEDAIADSSKLHLNDLELKIKLPSYVKKIHIDSNKIIEISVEEYNSEKNECVYNIYISLVCGYTITQGYAIVSGEYTSLEEALADADVLKKEIRTNIKLLKIKLPSYVKKTYIVMDDIVNIKVNPYYNESTSKHTFKIHLHLKNGDTVLSGEYNTIEEALEECESLY